MRNLNLNRAKLVKNDEFYTQYSDIEKEIKHYVGYNPDVFKGKTVICPCDDYEWSNFTKYFKDNFKEFGLSTLISTCYNANGRGKIQVITKDNSEGGYFIVKQGLLDGSGDMNGDEVGEYIDEVDFVITNPPFSISSEWLVDLCDKNKAVLILCSQSVITNNKVFPLLKQEILKIGANFGGMDFLTDTEEIKKVPTLWLTNMDFQKTTPELTLVCKYNQNIYKKFDKYDVINVDKIKEIPLDYFLPMGVPSTYLFKHDEKRFKILDARDYQTKKVGQSMLIKGRHATIGERTTFARVVIQRI